MEVPRTSRSTIRKSIAKRYLSHTMEKQAFHQLFFVQKERKDKGSAQSSDLLGLVLSKLIGPFMKKNHAA
uniref:Uncharacterized protein n=1 Tax=Curvibacter symbiont subsp. Hydra magnipapillata TaxID=667019 RepID=C9Y6P7_CURXX|nr:hypothetical protein Csp_E36240 [Curvibacter putative symbiont of Hydra magnipapillata]